MKLSRDQSSSDLIKKFSRLGYVVTRQKGSHIRLTKVDENENPHHITVPKHDPIKVGTLSTIYNSIAQNLGLSKSELIQLLEK
jgi:predicted RNA binding protein YcfA (HicA-like mRNA interferase family)